MSATVDRQTLVTYLDQLLDAGRGRDYGPNENAMMPRT